MAETACAGGICDASSKITTSNQRPAGKIEATTRGLIAQQGLIAVNV